VGDGAELLTSVTREDRRVKRDRSFRYGAVLALALALAIFTLLAPNTGAARTIEVLAAGATLEATVLTSRAPRRTRRAAGAALALAVVLAAAGSAVHAAGSVVPFAGTAVLLGATAAVIAAGVVRLILERGVGFQAVLGAIAIYVLVGLTFAFVIGAVAEGMDGSYFVQGDPAQSTRVYYSFTVLTTTGFGDYTARTRGGHALAVLEMLLGQLYLVTVIALLVGNLRRGRAQDGSTPRG
jgi:hypothetical protein